MNKWTYFRSENSTGAFWLQQILIKMNSKFLSRFSWNLADLLAEKNPWIHASSNRFRLQVDEPIKTISLPSLDVVQEVFNNLIVCCANIVNVFSENNTMNMYLLVFMKRNLLRWYYRRLSRQIDIDYRSFKRDIGNTFKLVSNGIGL